MSLPKAVKITKNGVEIISNVDRIQYTLKELERAALRDVGKLVCKTVTTKNKTQDGALSEKHAVLGSFKAKNS